MKIIITIIIILTCKISISQDTLGYLQKWNNPNKIKILTKNMSLNVNLNIDTSSAGYKIKTFYRGKIYSITNNEIVLRIVNENIDTIFGERQSVRLYRDYYISDTTTKINKLNLRSIPINKISTIDYFSTKHEHISGFGVGLTILSMTYAIIAPIFCINYKTGDFNKKFYYQSLAASGIGYLIGMPIYIIFDGNSHYTIKAFKPIQNVNNDYRIETMH